MAEITSHDGRRWRVAFSGSRGDYSVYTAAGRRGGVRYIASVGWVYTRRKWDTPENHEHAYTTRAAAAAELLASLDPRPTPPAA